MNEIAFCTTIANNIFELVVMLKDLAVEVLKCRPLLQYAIRPYIASR